MRKTKYMRFICWNAWVGYYNILGYIHWHRKDMDAKYKHNENISKFYKNDYKKR